MTKDIFSLILENNVEEIEKFLKTNTTFDVYNDCLHGWNILDHACGNGRYEIVKFLIQNG